MSLQDSRVTGMTLSDHNFNNKIHGDNFRLLYSVLEREEGLFSFFSFFNFLN